jgi:hypothetical protein
LAAATRTQIQGTLACELCFSRNGGFGHEKKVEHVDR